MALRFPRWWRAWFLTACAASLLSAVLATAQPGQPEAGLSLTNAEAVRELTPARADERVPVRIRGIVTFLFNSRSFFVQDETAGIYVGDGVESPGVAMGDLLLVEGVSGAGEYAPIVRPSNVHVLGHTNLPPPRRVGLEDLMSGSEDSQWVEVSGLLRSVQTDPSSQQIVDIASGSARLTAFLPSSMQSNLLALVDSRVRVRGVCGTWFNRVRQLFGVRLMVPRPEDVIIDEPPLTDPFSQPAQPLGNLLRFSPSSPHGHRVKVDGTVTLQQPGRALYVQDQQHGLFVQTRQAGTLLPGDRVQLVGFPSRGEYTPMLQDAVWKKMDSGPPPQPSLIGPDEALAGVQDCRLVAIEGRLLDHTQNRRDNLLIMEAGGYIFSAQLDTTGEAPLPLLQNDSILRLTGVCRIAVGEDWRPGQDWRAKSFSLVMRTPGDVQVLQLPPWWSLKKLFWIVGVLGVVVLACLGWVSLLHRKVRQQTAIIGEKLEIQARLKERYQDLFESANDVVYTHDLSGRITSINQAGEELLGLPRATIQQRSVLDFIPQQQRPTARQWLADIVDGKAPVTVEWDFVTAAGETVCVEISTRLIKHEGSKVEVEGIARNVTERRQLEKEILQVSAREQRRIGHDLHDGVCQQLAGISLLSHTLAENLQEQSRPEATEARKIADLVSQVNKQTRAVARGLFPVRLEENGLVSALEELVANTSAFFETRCEFSCDSPITVTDHNVAHNLFFIAQEAILNAIKHGKPSFIEVRLSADRQNRGLLVIRDNGTGVGSSPPPARGMGIRIMNYRAKMISGELQIRPREGGGLEVACRFPCEPAKPQPQVAAATTSPAAQ